MAVGEGQLCRLRPPVHPNRPRRLKRQMTVGMILRSRRRARFVQARQERRAYTLSFGRFATVNPAVRIRWRDCGYRSHLTPFAMGRGPFWPWPILAVGRIGWLRRRRARRLVLASSRREGESPPRGSSHRFRYGGGAARALPHRPAHVRRHFNLSRTLPKRDFAALPPPLFPAAPIPRSPTHRRTSCPHHSRSRSMVSP
jgi:hypothetical protein